MTPREFKMVETRKQTATPSEEEKYYEEMTDEERKATDDADARVAAAKA